MFVLAPILEVEVVVVLTRLPFNLDSIPLKPDILPSVVPIIRQPVLDGLIEVVQEAVVDLHALGEELAHVFGLFQQ